MAVSGGQMAVTCCQYPLLHSVLGAKLGIICYAAKFLKVVGGHCPVFAMPERPRKTTKSGEFTIYAVFSVYAVPTFMSCKSRPTYLHTYGLTEGRTTGRIDHGMDGLRDGLPAFTQDGYPYLIIYTELCT